MKSFFNAIKKSKILASPTWGAGELAPFGSLPVGSNKQKINIWTPDTEGDRAYNHHCVITEHNGVIYLAFSTHDYDEDGPGQYIRGSYSTDGGSTWSAPYTLIDRMSDMVRKEPVTHNYRCLTPSFWIKISGKLYLIADYSEDSPGEGGAGIATLAAKMDETTKQLGTPFVVYSTGSINWLGGYPSYTTSSESFAIKTELLKAKNIPRWGYDFESALPDIPTGVLEPSGITLDDGTSYRLWRLYPTNSKRKYLQKSKDGKTWTSKEAVGIIDNPSVTVWKVLSDGRVGMIGNDTINYPYGPDHRQNLYFAIADQDLNFESNNIYDVETGISGGQVFEGARKGGGPSYVDFCEYDGKIISGYSVYKESISASVFTLNF